MFQDAMNPESLDLIIPDEDLPFVWTKNTPDEPEEDEISSVRTGSAAFLVSFRTCSEHCLY